METLRIILTICLVAFPLAAAVMASVQIVRRLRTRKKTGGRR